MKKLVIKCGSFLCNTSLAMLVLLLSSSSVVFAQADAEVASTSEKKSLVKNTFESNLILEQQTVMVPQKGTLEWDIQHRFGIVNNGYKDLYGIFSPAMIRLGFEYVPVKDLQFGFGLCSDRLQLDLNAKYAILKQKKEGMPVSLTYYGNIDIDTRSKNNFLEFGDRVSYFSQLMIARKICAVFSMQAAISLSHFNNVPGYFDAGGEIQSTVKNDQFTLSLMGRYKVSGQMSILVDYDQPLTQNATNNPHPNLAAGIEIATSSHCFQIIVGNTHFILPQNNALYNENDYAKGQFLIGFNMTKLWSL